MNNSLNRNFTVSCHFTRRWWENFEDVRGVRRHSNIKVTIDEFQSEVARRWSWLFLASQFTFRNLTARIIQSGTALPSLGIWWPHVTDIKFWYWQSLVPMLSAWCVCVLGLNTPRTCIQTALSHGTGWRSLTRSPRWGWTSSDTRQSRAYSGSWFKWMMTC